MRRVLFLLNPLLAERRGRRAIVERCAASLRTGGHTVEMQDTLSDALTGQQARTALADGFNTIFACGGDGTLLQILQGVAGSDISLGVIPIGTGNVLAQNLRLPRDPIAAFELQRRAEAVSISLGEVICKLAEGGGERRLYFALAAGIGMHAAVMNLAPNGSGKRVWGRGAYYFGGLRLLLRHPIPTMDVKFTHADGGEQQFRACEVLAVRVPMIGLWRAGGKLRSAHLRMAAVPHTGRIGLAHACFHALVTGISIRESRLCYPRYEEALSIECSPAEGSSPAVPLLVQGDGEVVGVERAIFKMSDKKVRLLWPRTASGRGV